MNKERLKHLCIEQGVIASDVDDLAIENDIDEMTKTEVDVLTTKVETLQTWFATIHGELQLMLNDEYKHHFSKLHDKALSTIKDIVKQLKFLLKFLRHEEEAKRNQQQ